MFTTIIRVFCNTECYTEEKKEKKKMSATTIRVSVTTRGGARSSKRGRRSGELVQLEKTAEKEISLYLGASRYEGFGGNRRRRRPVKERELVKSATFSRPVEPSLHAIGIIFLSWPRPHQRLRPWATSLIFAPAVAKIFFSVHVSTIFEFTNLRASSSRSRFFYIFFSSFVDLSGKSRSSYEYFCREVFRS